VEQPTANGAYITKLIITLHQHLYELHVQQAKYPRRKGNDVKINPKKVFKQIYFKRMDDDHKENIGIIINFNSF
jgi:hypothetical protein